MPESPLRPLRRGARLVYSIYIYSWYVRLLGTTLQWRICLCVLSCAISHSDTFDRSELALTMFVRRPRKHEVDPTMRVVTFPLSAAYYVYGAGRALREALARMSPGEIAEMRQRFQVTQWCLVCTGFLIPLWLRSLIIR